MALGERCEPHIRDLSIKVAFVGESQRRVSWATFYNILSGVFPVDRRMVGIVLKHDYILHIYPPSMKDEKNN